MIRLLDASIDDVFGILQRRTIQRDPELERVVAGIIDDVARRGDEALIDNARRFDAPSLQRLQVTHSELDEATLPPDQVMALEAAMERITAFHREQWRRLAAKLSPMELEAGSGPVEGALGWRMPRRHSRFSGQRVLPLERVGIYVPGGKAIYPSSVLMNSIPAWAAGVRDITVTTPARRDGSLAEALRVALKLSPVTHTFKVGGAAAIAAMALGTETVPRVDKVVGPGNRYVNEAKRQLWGRVGLDGYAGPSEVAVLVDGSANARWAAADLLTQIEHSEDNAAFLVSWSRDTLRRVLEAAEELLRGQPREELLRKALADESYAILARDLEQACEIVDAIAPEHLTIMTSDPEATMARIRNAGCILLGEHTPESASDWAIGPSHTLPTLGGARFSGPLNVLDFIKVQSVSRLTPSELRQLLPTLEAFGTLEGFPLHAQAARIRFDA